MRTLILAFFCSCCLTLVYSCGSGTKTTALKARQEQLVETDSLTYSLRRTDSLAETAIGFSYSNRTADTLYIVNCNGAFSGGLRVRTASGWRDLLFPPVNQCLSAPVIIPPGAVYKATFFVRDILPVVRRGLDENAEYRIILMNVVRHYNTARRQFGDPVPETLRSSNSFHLRR